MLRFDGQALWLAWPMSCAQTLCVCLLCVCVCAPGNSSSRWGARRRRARRRTTTRESKRARQSVGNKEKRKAPWLRSSRSCTCARSWAFIGLLNMGEKKNWKPLRPSVHQDPPPHLVPGGVEGLTSHPCQPDQPRPKMEKTG